MGQTRRTWIVTIAQTAVGLGLTDRPAVSQDANPLPPGLYGPSPDHLSHALRSTERFHPFVSECPTDYVRPRTGRFVPLFFSASEFAVIRRLTELLLGETPGVDGSDPGSISQEVAEWIDLRVSSAKSIRDAALRMEAGHRAVIAAYHGSAYLKKMDTPDSPAICRSGLEWIATWTKARHPEGFLSLPAGQQLEMLGAISDERSGKQAPNSGTRFFDFLKAETIRGFYTSRTGLQELGYKGNAYYARSPGCNARP